MKFHVQWILLFLLAAAALPFNAGAQLMGEDWLKSEYTILLSSYVSWPDEAEIDSFHVGVLASQEIYVQMSLKSGLQTLKEKPFYVSYFKRLKDLEKVHILYIGEKKNNSLKKISNRIGSAPVLLVTDSALVTEYTMIDLLGMNMGGGKSFQLNKTKMEEAGLDVSAKILLVGGNEDDLRDIYRELEDEGDRMRAELDTLNLILEARQKELADSEHKLAEQTREVEKLVHEIVVQTEELSTLSDSVDLKELDLIEKIQLLSVQEERIKQREAEINELNNSISEKQAEIDERSKTIEDQLEDIARQTLMRNEQEKILSSQKIQIERQRTVLLFFLIMLLLILGVGFMSFRAYQIKKRANRILQEKNKVIQMQKSDIMNQKEEIQTQRDELQIVNRKIEKQNENITDSIYYALTIQQAILPDVHEMKKVFEGFIIYLPKDIVSGDFYWFTRQVNKSGEQSYYFAVVDCTGHGVPGGFLSMIGARALDAIVNEFKTSRTDKILEMMDKRIRHALNQQKTDNDDGMDVCLCKIIPGAEESGETFLSFSGARRNLFLMRGNKEVEIVKGDRRTIGGKHFNPTPFKRNDFALQKGDRIYLTSDGLMDQHSPERVKFGTKRFIDFLNGSGGLSMNEQQTKLEEVIMSFMNLEKQRDDITIMGIKM